MRSLLIPREADRLLRYPRGRTVKLALAGLIPYIQLPDGEIRFDEAVIDEMLSARPPTADRTNEGVPA